MVALHEQLTRPEVKPEKIHASAWAQTPRVQAEVIKQVASEHPFTPIDLSAVMKGMGTNLILDDDMNALIPVSLEMEIAQIDPKRAGVVPQRAEQALTDLDDRLDFELTEANLPSPISGRLQDVRTILHNESFTSVEERFTHVYDEWRRVRLFVRNEVDQDPELQATRDYARTVLTEVQASHGHAIQEGIKKLSHV